MNFFFQFFRWVGVISGYPVNWALFTRKVYYEDKIDYVKAKKGGALIIENHYNPWDYVQSVFMFFPRMLYVVASEFAFKNALITFGMKFWGGIVCDRRTRSLRFVNVAAQKIKEGNLVLIFPEGHNTDDGTIKKFYPSYIKIALEAKCPIIPIITDGNYRLSKRLHVIIGKTIDLSEYIDWDNYTREDIYRLNDMVREKVLLLREKLDENIEKDREKRKGKKKK